jgi:hypothetical protein
LFLEDVSGFVDENEVPLSPAFRPRLRSLCLRKLCSARGAEIGQATSLSGRHSNPER